MTDETFLSDQRVLIGVGTSTADSQVAVYDELAGFYDVWTNHPRYAGWVDRLFALAQHGRPPFHSVLDVGCGTGKSTIGHVRRGLRVVGCDPSPGMLSIARRRLGTHASLHVAGLPDLRVPGRYDYVSCLNDVMNYVPSGRPLRLAVAALRERLRPGGVLVFDASTIAMYRELFAQATTVERGAHRFRWSGETGHELAHGQVATATLIIEDRAGRVVLEQRHVQHHHQERDVRHAIETAGLRLIGVWGHRDDGIPQQPIDPTFHTKLVWLAERP